MLFYLFEIIDSKSSKYYFIILTLTLTNDMFLKKRLKKKGLNNNIRTIIIVRIVK